VGAGGAWVGAGAGAEVGAGAGFGAGVLVAPLLVLRPLSPLVPELVLPDDVDSFLAGFFFFLGSDFRAGNGEAPAMSTLMLAEASSTVSVPAALDLAGVLAPLSEPPEALSTPKARRKATNTAPTVMPI
jgi:hypothetical protein